MSTGKPIDDPTISAPPELLASRRAAVYFSELDSNENPLNYYTIVIPHDEASDTDKWFTSAEPASLHRPVRNGNEVKYLIGGQAAFGEFADAMESTKDGDDFIYILAWHLDHKVELRPGRRVGAILQEASVQRRVEIRVLIPPFVESSANGPAWGFINQLPTGAALMDNKLCDVFGIHHQKVILVKTGSVLTAFCGGVDINQDRLSVVQPGRGQPLHDVHCRIRGPAAYDLLRLVYDRISDLMDPSSTKYCGLDKQILGSTFEDKLRIKKAYLASQFTHPGKASMKVQIVRTHGCVKDQPYKFAPEGERSIYRMIEHGIKTAERFIYFEDQYMVSEDIARLLAAQAPKLEHITIVCAHNRISDLPLGVEHRAVFVRLLNLEKNPNIRIFSLCGDVQNYSRSAADKLAPSQLDVFFRNSYVHSKVWIFDDEFAVIGSANCNNRGMSHDSEVAAGIYDPSSDDRPTFRFAHRLRIKLWAMHLGMDNPEGHAQLADGVASAGHWLYRQSGTRVVPFDAEDAPDTDYYWRIGKWEWLVKRAEGWRATDAWRIAFDPKSP